MKIRTAILGYGRSGSSMHAGAVAGNADDFEMVAACDVDAERQKQAKERFDCAVYDDYHEMLEKEYLDLVSVITRSNQHCQMVCDCLAAGVNVLVTKPWAINADEAERMVGAASATDRILFPWLPARWGRDIRRLRELMAEQAIGKVFLVRRAQCSFATRCDWQTESRYGGGYLLNWGPHIIEPPYVLMDSKVESVYGRLKQTINPGDVEDVFFAVLNLADGTIVQAEYTVSCENLPNWFIQGDRGTIVVNGDALTMYQKTPPRPDDPTKYGAMKADDGSVVEETLTGAQYGDQVEVYAEVAQAIRGEKEFPVKPEAALELSRVFDAIKLSDRENRVVQV